MGPRFDQNPFTGMGFVVWWAPLPRLSVRQGALATTFATAQDVQASQRLQPFPGLNKELKRDGRRGWSCGCSVGHLKHACPRAGHELVTCGCGMASRCGGAGAAVWQCGSVKQTADRGPAESAPTLKKGSPGQTRVRQPHATPGTGSDRNTSRHHSPLETCPGKVDRPPPNTAGALHGRVGGVVEQGCTALLHPTPPQPTRTVWPCGGAPCPDVFPAIV